MVLHAMGVLVRPDRALLAAHYTLLKETARGNPGVVEVVYRQTLSPDDGFAMEPGFENFDSVEEGQLLARDAAGEIRAPRPGRMLLPLYQGQGDDGFFLGHEVRRSWLRVSAVLRRLGCDRLVPYLPGVSRDPLDPEQLIVNRRVARFFVVELLHLCGYRRVSAQADRLAFVRRTERRPGRRPGRRRKG